MASKDGGEKPGGSEGATDKTVITQTPVDEQQADTPEEAAETGPSVPLGALINNNYRIQKLIAAGGMGEVFSGENVHTDDPVAIKIILQSLARDEKVVTLFKREARILGQLSDEAIVRYHNFVHDPELDRFCLIMEYIDGIPLSDYVKQAGPLPLEAAKRLILRLSSGLEKAHKREVTHRDLSPDNVMLRNGDVDQAVLIDFGIAKSTEMSDGTLHGQLAGKFKYISPEQLGHFEGRIGPRTDVYGLALLVAAAVCGKPLEMGSSVVEAVDARRAIPDLSCVYPELRPLLAHMLEPDPANRPACMLDVARMLRDPALIPPKYTGGANPPRPDTAERTVIVPAPTGAATGLQQPPGTLQPVSIAPTASGDTSESPFGGGTATPFPNGPTANIPTENTSATKAESRKFPWVFAILALALAAGGAGWYAVNRDNTATLPPLPDPPVVAETTPAEPENPPLPAPDTTTREGFLATYQAGPCSYVTRASAGLNAGKLVGFAPEEGRFEHLPSAYSRAFGAQPDVVERIINPAQCAALDLLRGLQGRDEIPPVMILDADVLQSGGTVVGRIRETRGRSLWLFLVSAEGGVHNLSSRLKPQPDGSYVFSFGLALAQGSAPTPQLIVALASEEPLLSAAAAGEGAEAASLLPLVMSEIEGRGGKAAAAIAFFRLEHLGMMRVTGIPADDPDGGLVVRSGPGTGFSRILVIPEGVAVNIVGTSPDGQWSRAQFSDGGFGWVRNRYLSGIGETPE